MAYCIPENTVFGMWVILPNFVRNTTYMKNIVLCLLIASALFTSCSFGGRRVKGNGSIRTEDRNVSSFSKVQVHGDMDVYVSQGSAKSLRIEGDDNLLQYIEIVQQGDEITIRPKDGVNLDPSGNMKVYLTAPVYKSIDVSGACNITGQTKIDNDENLKLQVSGAGDIKMDVSVPEIDAKISGSGNVNLKGQTRKFDLDLTGAGKAHCYDLLSETTTVDISGAGDAEVFASVKLDAQVSGAGTITYKGNAKSVKQEVSGAGSVRKVD